MAETMARDPAGMSLVEIGAGHPVFKELLRIRRGSVAAHESRIVAEGLWAVQLLLDLGTPIEQLFCSPELIHSDSARACAAAAAARSAHAFRLSARSMHRVAEREAPEGLLALVRAPRWQLADLPISGGALIVVVDGLENPGNLGTLLRTADGAGVELVMVTNRRARITHPQVFRASHGMSLKVPHVEFPRAEDATSWLREHGCTVYLAAPGGGVHYQQLDGRRAHGAGVRQRTVRPVAGVGEAGLPARRDSHARRRRLPERGGGGRNPVVRGTRPQGRLDAPGAPRPA